MCHLLHPYGIVTELCYMDNITRRDDRGSEIEATTIVAWQAWQKGRLPADDDRT